MTDRKKFSKYAGKNNFSVFALLGLAVFGIVFFIYTKNDKENLSTTRLTNRGQTKSANQIEGSTQPTGPQPDALPLKKQMSSYEELLKKLNSNDYCDLNFEEYHQSDKVKALMQAPDIYVGNSKHDDTILLLFSGGALTKNQSNLAPVTSNDWLFEYYEALLLGDYISNFENDVSSKRDPEKAEKIFKHLEEKFPDNGVFPFVRAGLLKRLDADRNLIRQELIHAMDAPYFEPYIQLVASRLYQKGLSNTAYFFLSVDVYSKMAIPIFNESYNLLINYLDGENYDEFIKKAEAFAYKIRPAQIPPNGRWEFVEWDALRYSNYVRLLNKILKVTALPDDERPNLKKLKEVLNYDVFMAESPFIVVWGADRKVCIKQMINNEVAAEGARYLDYIKKYGSKNSVVD